MSKTVQVKKHFSFVAGLNTEASPLTFPPNTWADGDNVIPERDGSINLRKSMDFEEDYELSSGTLNTAETVFGAFVAGEWNNVAGNGNRHFLVVQQESSVTFYINSNEPISAQEKSFSVNLATYKAAGSTEITGYAPISLSTVTGKLIITSRDTEPLLVTYVEATDTITVEQIDIMFRDFVGVAESVAVDDRPVALTAAHNYNLLNQGWVAAKITSYQASAGRYPSNAQSWTAGKDTNDDFSPTLLDKQDFGTSPAPKGRFVLNLFNRDRSTASGVVGLTTETELYRPTTCAFFAGRAWYAGVKSGTIGSWVLFSQVAESDDNLGKCYQDADPTSEVISDLVDSDGGIIPIQDAGTILKLVPFQDSLLVICDNGIWQIAGGGSGLTAAGGFSASSYAVARVTVAGCVSAKSIILTDTGVFYWGEDGIYILAATQTGDVAVQPISAGTIQTLYDDIPMMGKVYSSGVYVPNERLIYWLYSDDPDNSGVEDRFKKNRVLCLNTLIKAYYTMTISELAAESPYVVDLFLTRSRSTAEIEANVVDHTDRLVVVGAVQVVATFTPDVVAVPVVLKFLTVAPQSATTFKTTISNFNKVDDAPIKFMDWYKQDNVGIGYTGFVLPGFDFGAEQGGDKNIQALYVITFFRRTETGIDVGGEAINASACTMQAQWDFSDTNASNRWSVAQQVYRHRRLFLPSTLPQATYNDGQAVVVTKNKVRGRGKALQLKFTSTIGKDMQLLGWAITYVGNANV